MGGRLTSVVEMPLVSGKRELASPDRCQMMANDAEGPWLAHRGGEEGPVLAHGRA